MNARLKIFLLAALCFIIASGAYAQNPTNRPANWARKLEVDGLQNCYQVTTNLYRGAQPTAEGMAQLQALGVRMVISLRVLRSDRQELNGTGLKRLARTRISPMNARLSRNTLRCSI